MPGSCCTDTAVALLIQSFISPCHLQEQLLHIKAKGSVRKGLVFAGSAVSAEEFRLDLWKAQK